MNQDFFKSNAIGVMRFGLALSVILQHGAPPGYTIDPFTALGWHLLPDYALSVGNLAVLSFFFLSGLLIAHSWSRADSATRYLWQRFLRIFPGFWVCLLLSAFVLGPAVYYFDNDEWRGYWQLEKSERYATPWGYVRYNLVLQINQYRIRYIFVSNPGTDEINISLWTLATEFACYMLPPFLWLFRSRRLRWIVGTLISCSFLFSSLTSDWPMWDSTIGNRLLRWLPSVFAKPEQRYWVVFFLIGWTAHALCARIAVRGFIAVPAIVLALAACWCQLGGLLLPFALPYFLLWLAAVIPWKSFDRKVDLSYGMYIYGFPVQQTLLWAGVARMSVMLHIGLAITIPMLLALASWTLIERPCLKLKHVRMAWPGRRPPACGL
jgi:peptidoglycan/LPS O-acetylase OafA/YrhL